VSLWPLIVFHICAGTIALLSGFVAMSLRKGSRDMAWLETCLSYPCWPWAQAAPSQGSSNTT
jgi:hypothetical protein